MNPDPDFDGSNLPTLRRLAGKVKPRRIAVTDIETYDWVNPYAVGFYDGVSYLDFWGPTCIEDSLKAMLHPGYSNFWIYAHNGGNFDFLFFLKKLLKMDYKVEITPIQSCMFMVEVRKDSYVWTFVDSARLLPIKLNDLGETFGIGHKVELEMTYNQLARPENKPLAQRYLKQDCRLLYHAIKTFQIKINDLGGSVQATLPSTALDVFRRRYLKDDIFTNRHFITCEEVAGGTREEKQRRKKDADADAPTGVGSDSVRESREAGVHGQGKAGTLPANRVPDGRKSRAAVHRRVVRSPGWDDSGPILEKRCHGCAHDFIRQAYYGGRTEIFRMKYQAKKRGEFASLYDINSHYPHCMLEPMPTGPGVLLEGATEAEVLQTARTKTGIVDCDVEIPEDCYLPPLPYRHHGKLIFPTGRFSGTWNTVELSLLPRVGGRILKTRRALWFDCEPVFAEYIKRLYQFRDKKSKGWNKGMDWIAKILMNSTYGKFGMREERSRFIIHPDTPAGLKIVDLESDLWSQEVLLSPNYVVPQLAVHVTALARARLWEILQSVIDRGGNIYYCDTDSVVCSGVELDTGSELGKLKLENRIRRAMFVLPKLYLIETEEENKAKQREKNVKVKAKGMGPGIRINMLGDDELAGQLSEEEFMSVVAKGMPLDRHRLTKFRESLRDYAKELLSFPRVIPTHKQIQSEYDKRTVLPDYDTKPVVIQLSN